MNKKTLKDKVRHALVTSHDKFFYGKHIDEHKLKGVVIQIIKDIVNSRDISLSQQDEEDIINEIVNEFIGLGEIEVFMKDPMVTEIMINGPRKVYIEKMGRKMLTNVIFDDDASLMRLIYRILSPTRRRVDEYSPYTDVSLPDGSRVNIIIPPLALDGPTITIRKFSRELKKAEDLIALGTLDKRMSDFLIASIKAKINIVFSGSTGAGKTTTLNVFSSYISEEEWIITIEDTAELHLAQEHVVRLEAKQANIEGKGEITIRELFKNSLRMRPSRIILGEIKGAEALDMLQAACSGHRGSLVVIHGNSPQDVIYRLETIILTSGVPIALEVIQRQIANAIHLIVHQEQLSDGSRKITHISQVNGLRNGEVVVEDIFTYIFEGIDAEGNVRGRWEATGIIPVFYHLFKKAGIELSEHLFNKG